MKEKARKVLEESCYVFTTNAQFEDALTLVCHVSVLRQERELVSTVPRLFGARRMALYAYSQHLEQTESLRQQLKKQGFDWRAIEKLALAIA